MQASGSTNTRSGTIAIFIGLALFGTSHGAHAGFAPALGLNTAFWNVRTSGAVTRTGKTVISACEAQHTHRGHDQFARVTVRVEAHEHLGLSVGHALAADHELFEHWRDVCAGVQDASHALGTLAARVTVLDAVVHPVDSGRRSFQRATARAIALAAAQRPLVDVVLTDAQFPLVRSIAGRGEATVRGVRVVADPEDAGLDAPVDWTARWGDIDPIAERAARDVVAALRDERPPWVGLTLHFGESLSLGRGATPDAVRDAVALALGTARPVERRAARLPLEDLRLSAQRP